MSRIVLKNACRGFAGVRTAKKISCDGVATMLKDAWGCNIIKAPLGSVGLVKDFYEVS